MEIISKRLMRLLAALSMERWFGLFLGIAVFGVVILHDPLFGMPDAAWRCVALVLLMGIWWATEAIPLAATALLPIPFIPMLDLGNMKAATAPYAHPTIYLFFGGFLLGVAMEKYNLHKRIALWILNRVGTSPRTQIAGFMVATGFISMWVSNTATAIMMLPIGISVASVITSGQDYGESKRFSCALMLSIAYSASIGGLGTLIGTPPNALLRAFLVEHYNIHVGFGQWMLLGVPLSIVLGVLTWAWLVRKPFRFEGRNVHEYIHAELDRLGPVTLPEILVSAAFGCAALCWVFQPLIAKHLPFVGDTFIAMIFGLSLFIIPLDLSTNKFLMGWSDTREMPWGVLLLFGGGLSLAGAINVSGLAAWMAEVLGSMQGVPFVFMIFILVIVVQIMTEFTSNTATTAAFLPLVGIMAVGQGLMPTMYAIPAALAASCAFMLPVSTPPNAIVFRSGAITVSDMLRAGFVLTLTSGVVVTALVCLLVPSIFH